MSEYIAPFQPWDQFRLSQGFTGEGNHEGGDIADADGTALDNGTPALAVADGWHCSSTRYEPTGYGQLVDLLSPDGSRLVRYAHLAVALVAEGDVVTQGQVIALSDNSGASTGPHCHFEHRDMTQHLPRGLPIDPTPFLLPWVPAPTPAPPSSPTIQGDNDVASVSRVILAGGQIVFGVTRDNGDVAHCSYLPVTGYGPWVVTSGPNLGPIGPDGTTAKAATKVGPPALSVGYLGNPGVVQSFAAAADGGLISAAFDPAGVTDPAHPETGWKSEHQPA